MKCPKCKTGDLLYARRGMIEEIYKTDDNGDETGEIIRTETDFYLNSHHYCDDCGYARDIEEDEEI